MTLERCKQDVIDLNIKNIGRAVQEAIAVGESPIEVLNALREGMEEVGRKFETGEYFLSELVMAGETMKEALNVLKLHLNIAETQSYGKVVLGTILGDLHDIGKDIVLSLLRSSGFEVYDLGTDVHPETFAQKAKEVEAEIVGISALLSTTVPTTAEVCKALDNLGIRDRVKVIIGGAAVRKHHTEKFGVDAAVNDAVEGIEIIKSWSRDKE